MQLDNPAFANVLSRIGELGLRITEDESFSIGGVIGGIFSYFTNTSVLELFDFSVHALVGGLISYSIRYGFEWTFNKGRKRKKEDE